MLYTLCFFSSKCSLFHNANLFGSCIIHILYTECAKIKKKNNSGAKGLIRPTTGEESIKVDGKCNYGLPKDNRVKCVAAGKPYLQFHGRHSAYEKKQ